jgi:hypothetical protein
MFSVITNIYNKKIKGPTLIELFTATGKLNFFWQLEMFDVCTMGDTAHIDAIFKFFPHTRQHGCVDILHCCLKARIIASVKNMDAPMLTRVWQELEYRIDVCRVTRGAHIEVSSCKKKLFQFSCDCEQFHYSRSFGFHVINVWNHGEHFETSCIIPCGGFIIILDLHRCGICRMKSMVTEFCHLVLN